GDGDGWRKAAGGLDARFRRLRTAAELEPVAELQQVIWGLTDRDVVPPHALMPVADTGGAVLGARHAGRDELAGFVFGWGGYVDGRPILVSAMLGVRRERRPRAGPRPGLAASADLGRLRRPACPRPRRGAARRACHGRAARRHRRAAGVRSTGGAGLAPPPGRDPAGGLRAGLRDRRVRRQS